MKLLIQTDFSNVQNMPLGFWILLAAILFTQAIWLYQDAAKHNANKWLWGIWGIIQAPTPLLVYFFVVRRILSRNKKEKRIRFLIISVIILSVIAIIAIAANLQK